jgi:hypothetical protein
VHTSELQRAGSIPGRGQSCDESGGGSPIKWLVGRQLTPPFHGAAIVSPALHVLRELLERLGASLSKPGALNARPALKLRRTAYMKAIEKRSAVQGGDCFEISPFHSRLQIADVATHDVSVEPQISARVEELSGV